MNKLGRLEMELMKIPHTCKHAQIKGFKYVDNVFALNVTNARYRNAVFSGIVELVNGTDCLRNFKGKFRAKVTLDWFGSKLKKHSRYITLDAGQFDLMPVYSGAVIANLG